MTSTSMCQGQTRKEVEADVFCRASSRDSLTSLASGWQFRPWHVEPVRVTKRPLLSHQLSAGLLGDIPWSAQVNSSEGRMEELDQLPVLATCTVMQALVSPPMNHLMYSLSQLFSVTSVVKHTMYIWQIEVQSYRDPSEATFCVKDSFWTANHWEIQFQGKQNSQECHLWRASDTHILHSTPF